eukprot:m.272690 g.272690  ORF g.272690 m.272690 type:complete len:59 (-) comp91656_c0_seq1:223-399(-)
MQPWIDGRVGVVDTHALPYCFVITSYLYCCIVELHCRVALFAKHQSAVLSYVPRYPFS